MAQAPVRPILQEVGLKPEPGPADGAGHRRTGSGGPTVPLPIHCPAPTAAATGASTDVANRWSVLLPVGPHHG